MTPGRTLVLLPYGMPDAPAHREACASILLSCGGDIERMIDRPVDDLERFGRYVSRIPALREGAQPPIVLLTRTSPLPLTVVSARRSLERAAPALGRASWILFVTDEDDPFFADGARRLGTLSAEPSLAPLWVGPDGMPFLVTTPETRAHDVISGRFLSLRAQAEKYRRGPVMTTRPPSRG
ncbi:MAG: hypothetical protein IT374_12290 [Polyangiaceae bacterium]|nr:hypothetical protein [Polyangiaceae bacterium]